MGNSLRKGISIFLSMIIVTSFFMGAVADSAFAAESGMSNFQTPSVIQLVKVEASEITNTVGT